MIKKCQVFTPEENVIELLDAVKYTSNLYGKKVIENACGDGNILLEIVKRYIEDSLKKNISIEDIKSGLEQDIYGAEIDKLHYKKCLDNLSEFVSGYGLYNVKWKILNTDILKEKLTIKFDFVIGNPPYITYRDLDNDTRDFVKDNFKSCSSGKFDYCYAFIEASLNSLSETGKLAYLIPSSIFKNVFGQKLRDMILPYTNRIIDYTTKKLFNQVLTSSAILVCDKSSIQDLIEYSNVVSGKITNIKKANLGNKWVFSNDSSNNSPKKKFGDYFNASISIATLLNEVYVLKNYDLEGDYFKLGDYKIEREIVRECASPRSLNYNKKELIIFPYQYNESSLVRYSSEAFEKKFTEATRYLKSFIEKLNKRNSDTSVEWFEYGRTQALAHLNQPKLLLSTIVTKEVKVYELSKECIPYSGIYIIPKNNLPLSRAKEILESESFLKYVKGIGINASGSSMRITAADINNFEF